MSHPNRPQTAALSRLFIWLQIKTCIVEIDDHRQSGAKMRFLQEYTNIPAKLNTMDPL